MPTVYLKLSHTNINLVERKRTAAVLAAELNQPDLPKLIERFLYDQLYAETGSVASNGHQSLPQFHGKISVYMSAISTFCAPSDLSGISGMWHERVQATLSWNRGPSQHDCVFVNVDPNTKGFLGLDVARVHLFFSIDYQGITYPCALIRWMSCLGDKPDEDTGMWMVEPASNADGTPFMSVIHLDCILRAAHLIGICGDMFLHKDLSFNQSLDAFVAFYVNKFVDHHAFEIAY